MRHVEYAAHGLASLEAIKSTAVVTPHCSYGHAPTNVGHRHDADSLSLAEVATVNIVVPALATFHAAAHPSSCIGENLFGPVKEIARKAADENL